MMSSFRRKIYNIYQKNTYFRKAISLFSSLLSPRFIFGKQFFKLSQYIKDTEFYSKKELENITRNNLVSIINHAKNNTVYYSKIFKNIQNDINKENIFYIIEKIPIIDKSEVIKYFSEFLAKNSKLKDYISTGGTSGEPFYFYINSDRSNQEIAFMYDQWRRIGFNLKSKRGVFRGLSIKDFFEDDKLTKERKFSSFKLYDSYLEKIWPHLLSYKPDYIHAYPSSAFFVAKYIKKYNKPIPSSLNGILLGSENLYESQRNFIEETFNTKSFSWYGHSEKLILAGECEYSNAYHSYPQYGYIEFVNKNGKKAKIGEFAEIVGTGFINTVMPFIRYRTGDWCTYLGESCPKCGRNYPIFEKVAGRWTQEVLVGRNKNLISMTSLNVHSKEFENIDRFQYFQDTPGEATLKVVANTKFSGADKNEIHRIIQEKLNDSITLKIDIVNEIPSTKVGKFKFIDQKIQIKNITGLI